MGEIGAGKAIVVPWGLKVCHFTSRIQLAGKCRLPFHLALESQGKMGQITEEKTFISTALLGLPSFLLRALATWVYLLCNFLFKLVSPSAAFISKSLI